MRIGTPPNPKVGNTCRKCGVALTVRHSPRVAGIGRRGEELNLRPLPGKGSALPLSYAPIGAPSKLQLGSGEGQLVDDRAQIAEILLELLLLGAEAFLLALNLGLDGLEPDLGGLLRRHRVGEGALAALLEARDLVEEPELAALETCD